MKILVIEDDRSQREILTDFLTTKDHQVTAALSGEDGVEAFYHNPVDVVITDYRMPGISGKEVLQKILEINPLTAVIVITAYSSVENAVELLKIGAFDYIEKPINLELLLNKIENAQNYIQVEKESKTVHDVIEDRDFPITFIAESKKMSEILSVVKRVAHVDASVLITGESGTGKEVIADIIHYLSSRRHRKMVKVNCSAIPDTLLESELFGHVRGAFTDAIRDRKGRFEEADGGTLFLDEIGDIAPMIQVKLLRALQTMEFEPVGSSITKKVNVRIIAATNKNIKTEVQIGNFREDLFYRLNVILIHLPPLRERKQDITKLVNHFLEEFSREEELSISHEALMMLINYQWEGNIRQLKNVIQRTVTLSRSNVIRIEDLPDEIKNFTISKDQSNGRTIAQVEKEHIKSVLEDCDHNQIKAAEILGVHRNTLSRKIKEYHIRLKK
ncbi:MAG: sigma-54-dependent Fis family transcriptional regulator [Candidatus Cloacimonetes bacterium]|nr:sigma-54-dependent Fis family transcriptional regulator [Candidatus Cloacimonadota bacterium]